MKTSTGALLSIITGILGKAAGDWWDVIMTPIPTKRYQQRIQNAKTKRNKSKRRF